MKQLIIGLVALAPLALVACDQNKSQSEQPASNVAATTNNDKTSTAGTTTGNTAMTNTATGMNTNPTAVGGGPAMGSRDWARDQIAQAYCNYFQGCGDVAKGKKYDDMDGCLTQRKADADKAFPADKCTKIDRDRFNACVDKIKSQKCGGLSSTPSECDDSKVCIEK